MTQIFRLKYLFFYLFFFFSFTGPGSVTMFVLNFNQTFVDTLYIDVTNMKSQYGIVFRMTTPDTLLSKSVCFVTCVGLYKYILL